MLFALIILEAANDLALLAGRDPSVVFETNVNGEDIPVLPLADSLHYSECTSLRSKHAPAPQKGQ